MKLSIPLAAALCLLAQSAIAQTDLTAISLSARAYEQVTSWQERGFRPAGLSEVVRVPGHILLDVRAVLDGPWSDTIERAQAGSRDIRLVLPDGRELEPEGGYQYWGQLGLIPRTISARRPRDFPEADADIHWNGLFLVPEGVTQATLTIASDDIRFSGVVSVPKTSTPETAASFARFEPQGIRRFRVAELQDGNGAGAVPSTITALPGTVLAEIEVQVTGVAGNNADGDDRFNWSTSDFRLTDPQGQTLPLIGERFIRRVLDSQFNGVDIGDSAERTMLWLVPEGLTEARLVFGETEVATVALASAAITETD
ncbi:hypothetical protein [Pararhodobacter aggregans]|uniref:Uncharacterized protein n=1 Tax=Pararhodobacter aggregans TaxID=404875 RepID=A0A2T7UMT8_9RHOB|nr:hypothetical protein [Pararhodobacter aggregans]PTX02403.1 hypothetical protein C8N33_105223 [Pararhodobacter aggregans]PVE46015.1 hypothetical protein DDE23_17620 [Pararhodobacter aggregans]